MELSHEVEGHGEETLVLGNALGTTPAMWDALAGKLAEHRRVIRYDHRGHGRSPAPPGPYTIDDIAGDVLELLDRLQVDRVSCAGVSLGGMVGMWLAAHAPDRIDRLVVCCTSPHMPPESRWQERAAAVREAGSVAVVADAVSARWLTPEYAEAHPEAREALRGMLAASPPEGYASCCEAIGGMDLRPSLGAIQAPTLVIAGDRDEATPADLHGRVAAQGIPGARFVIVQDAAHIAPVQQPEAILALITDHLEGD
jgi:3-oxoadipate enol-lactonase